jgi:single-strand DNA-binding protein
VLQPTAHPNVSMPATQKPREWVPAALRPHEPVRTTKNEKSGEQPGPASEPVAEPRQPGGTFSAEKMAAMRRASSAGQGPGPVPEEARGSALAVKDGRRRGQRLSVPEPGSEHEGGAPRSPGPEAGPQEQRELDSGTVEAHTPTASPPEEPRVPEPDAVKAAGSGLPVPPLTERPDRADGHQNEVCVVGRVTAAPLERELPSGDRLVTWRICVARPRDHGGRGARADSLTLVSFDPRVRDRVHGWRIGDVVRVTGELRRRIWRGRTGVRSVLEVEVDSAAVVRGARP